MHCSFLMSDYRSKNPTRRRCPRYLIVISRNLTNTTAQNRTFFILFFHVLVRLKDTTYIGKYDNSRWPVGQAIFGLTMSLPIHETMANDRGQRPMRKRIKHPIAHVDAHAHVHQWIHHAICNMIFNIEYCKAGSTSGPVHVHMYCNSTHVVPVREIFFCSL